jgi:phosphatidylserine/phosphatidylglycerophosphate/cardiolipin synthase-like enzyme
MQHLHPEVERAFLALALTPEIGAAICAAVADGSIAYAIDVRRMCTSAGLSGARAGEVARFLEAASEQGLFRRVTALTWAPENMALHAQLAPLLIGANIYLKKVHADKDIVQVVITKPPLPSRFAAELLDSPEGDWGLVDTRASLPLLAERASRRFCIMTPFVDDVGASVLVDLFRLTRRGVRRVLITRGEFGNAYPAGLMAVLPEFRALAVETLDFRLDKEAGVPGKETSHAKVVIADDAAAYVGSLNMNRWSLEYSLELGVCVYGLAAAKIARVVDASTKVAVPMRE